MTTALLVAGMVAATALSAAFCVWLWEMDERKAERRQFVIGWRAARVADFPDVSLDAAHRDAIEATLVRHEIFAHDTLIAALERRPAELEVVA